MKYNIRRWYHRRWRKSHIFPRRFFLWKAPVGFWYFFGMLSFIFLKVVIHFSECCLSFFRNVVIHFFGILSFIFSESCLSFFGILSFIFSESCLLFFRNLVFHFLECCLTFENIENDKLGKSVTSRIMTSH